MTEVMRFGENRPEREENGRLAESRSHELSAEMAQFCGLFGPAIGDGESLAGAHWRRERDSNPRYGSPYTHFPGVRLQPLGHPSGGAQDRRGGIDAQHIRCACDLDRKSTRLNSSH